MHARDEQPVGVADAGPGAGAPGRAPRPRRAWPSRRLALGLSPTPGPGLALLLVGMVLGPGGLAVLTDSVLGALDPAVSVALAALGVLAGLEIDPRRPDEGRLLAAATIESGVTILVVVAGLVLVNSRWPVGPNRWLVALVAGVCAASSSTPARPPDEARSSLARIGDLDDVLPIVVGVAVIAWMRSAPPAALAGFVVQAVVIAAAIAGVAWLLLYDAASESEQRVFVIGTLLLLGGAAAYLRLSALLIGLVAAGCWVAAGGSVRDRVTDHVRSLQHPLMVLLLVVAGARLQIVSGLLGLAAAYVAFRIGGKLAGGWLAGRVAREAPRDVGISLVAPGIVGVAIALNLLQAQGDLPGVATIFAVVASGSLALDLLAFLIPRLGDRL